MTKLHAATVITEAGTVVGVHFAVSPAGEPSGPRATLHAGPGQVAHAMQLAMPARSASRVEIEHFHAEVERLIRAAP